jgi:hypothetical protein
MPSLLLIAVKMLLKTWKKVGNLMKRVELIRIVIKFAWLDSRFIESSFELGTVKKKQVKINLF